MQSCLCQQSITPCTGLEDAVLVLLYMCKNGTTANRAVTELGITFRDDMNVSIPTAQWLLGMIGAMDPDKMDVLCRRMLKSTIKDGSGLERKTGHMLAIDKHLIPFTGADRHNDPPCNQRQAQGRNIPV